MSLVNGQDLIDAGWQPSGQFRDLLDAAAAYEARGIGDKDYILKLLARDYPKAPAKLRLRDAPLGFGEAIEATGPEDENNIQAVRRFMRQLLKSPVIEAGAVMPDACPAGAAEATIPVGGAIAVKNAIIPSAHSADICCSMYATVFRCEKDTGQMLDSLMASTRFGVGGRKPQDLVPHPVVEESVWDNKFLNGLQHHAAIHMADQGDGNHFAYIGKLTPGPDLVNVLSKQGYDEVAKPLHDAGNPEAGFYVLVTHHGSRGLGAQVYKRGQKAALKETARVAENIPKAAAWLDATSDVGQEYWEALQYVGRWTKANHQSIHHRFLERVEAAKITEFGNEHNFVWRRGDIFLHGKGATPAWKDAEGRPLLGLIPLNMAAPILMTLGRDNETYLSFCPHGAGRNRSRTATLRDFRKKDGSLDEDLIARTIAKTTKGLDIRWFYGRADLSETPVAYKSATQVREQIDRFELADVVAQIEPLGCIMAGDTGPKPWEREKDLTPKQKRQIEHRAGRRKLRQSLKGGKSRGWEE